MATTEQYTEVAPTVMGIGEFTAAQVENKLDNIPEPPAPTPIPSPTKQQCIDIFNIVFETSEFQKNIAEAGGYKGIANTVGLKAFQVKVIAHELAAMVALRAAELAEE